MINIQEAIEKLTQMLDEFCNEDSYVPECKEAVDMATNALEKQIPKPVRMKTSIKRCPVCSKYLSSVNNKYREIIYCVRCGQAIDWSDEG